MLSWLALLGSFEIALPRGRGEGGLGYEKEGR